MKSKTILLYLTFVTLIALVVLMFMPYPGQDELMRQERSTPAIEENLSPQYGNLTDDQIAIADRAIGDLLNSVEGITPSMIAVKQFEPKEFGDASLGCPMPGQNYAQVISPGYQVILEAGGQEYDYRLDMSEAVLLCEK